MAMNNATQYALAQNIAFQQRVQIAMGIQAINIQAEAAGTGNHTNRSNYAKLVLNSPQSYSVLFAAAVVTQTDPTRGAGTPVDAATTDADLGNLCAAVWNALAGVI
jgi:hypothetical protein